MTITLDAAVLTTIALVVGGFIIALARQVSVLTSDVTKLVDALAAEREERLTAISAETSRRENGEARIHDRIDSLTMQTRVKI